MTCHDLIKRQLRNLKQADKSRFIVGNFEYELRAGGTAFTPLFYIGMRKKDSYRGHFTEIGCVNAIHLYCKADVIEAAKKKIEEVMR